VMGNWDDVTSGSTGGGTTTDDRGHNKQNQITSGAPSASYDSAGNTTQFTDGGVARKYVYDAWNRLVRVTNTAGTTTHVAYAHDALGRRVCVVTGAPAANPCQTTGGITTDLYYSDSWQVLEEKVGSTTKVQYVWSPVYVDAMVLRDRDANGTPGDGLHGQGLEQRLYVQQDANFNVTALVDTSGNAVERYVYDPYGAVTYLSGSWGRRGSSEYAWVYLHQGGRYEDNAKLYHFRNRELSPTLGRWMQNDPLGYGAGDANLYRALANSPLVNTDFLGLIATQDNKAVPEDEWLQEISKKGALSNTSIDSVHCNGLTVKDQAALAQGVISRDFPIHALTSIFTISSELFPGPQGKAMGFLLKQGVGFIKKGSTWVLASIKTGKELTAKQIKVLQDAWKSNPAAPTIRNAKVAGSVHPKTKIPFDAQGFPDFSGVAKATVKIPQTGNYADDFAAANKAAGFSATPKGYTWHHHQDGFTMQLVPQDIHKGTGHTGSLGLGK